MTQPSNASGLPSSTPAAAVQQAASAPALPLWSMVQQQLSNTKQHVARVAADFKTFSQTWKAPDFSKGLGVKVDIDMLTPAVSSIKQQYQALPEPVRDVLPFAGVAAVTSIAVSRVYDSQLRHAQQRYGLLSNDHEHLQEQLAQLEAQLQDTDAHWSHAQVHVQMAEALAKATNAAAAAATAAAAAATAAAAAAPSGPQPKDGHRWT